MELTKEHFDKMLAKLATSEELQSLKTDFGAMKETLDGHTTTLALLVAEKKKRDENKTVETDRLDHIEQWAKRVGQKLGVEFER